MTRRALLFLLAYAAAMTSGWAQSGPPSQSGAVLARIDALVQRVSQLRGLSVLRHVDRGIMDRPAILARLRARVNAEYPPGEVDLEGAMLRRVGLIPESMDYEQTIFSLLDEQVAGFYDPDQRRLFIASWLPDAMQDVTMAHEIVHALQDQHFDIARFTHHERGRGDAQTATMAVLEGDATLAMLEFVLEPAHRSVRDLPDPDAVFGSQLMDLSGQPRMAAAPRAIRDALMFPYRAGFSMCVHAFQQRGFAAMDALLQRPPASTEQVLHADKLASREPPIYVPASVPAGLAREFVLASDDVMGELGLRLFLSLALDDPSAESGAAGWGGDRAMLFALRSATQPAASSATTMLAWEVAFDPASFADTDAEAREFEQGAVRVLAGRYPRARVVTLGGVTAVRETASGRSAAVARRGRHVLVLDRAPSGRVADIVREMIGADGVP